GPSSNRLATFAGAQRERLAAPQIGSNSSKTPCSRFIEGRQFVTRVNDSDRCPRELSPVHAVGGGFWIFEYIHFSRPVSVVEAYKVIRGEQAYWRRVGADSAAGGAARARTCRCWPKWLS